MVVSEKEPSKDRVFLLQEGSFEEEIVQRIMAKEGEKGIELEEGTELYQKKSQTVFSSTRLHKKEDLET